MIKATFIVMFLVSKRYTVCCDRSAEGIVMPCSVVIMLSVVYRFMRYISFIWHGNLPKQNITKVQQFT